MPDLPTSVTPTARKALRIAETYGRTFLATFVAQLLLSGFNVTTITDMSQAKKLGIAAIAAGIQAVLSAAGLNLGKSGTVSLLPQRLDPATPPVEPSAPRSSRGTTAPYPDEGRGV